MLYVAYTDLNSLWCQWFGNVYEKPLKDHYINQSLDCVVSYNYFHNKKNDTINMYHTLFNYLTNHYCCLG